MVERQGFVINPQQVQQRRVKVADMSKSQKPPFAELADCLKELRALPYWTKEEIDLVRTTAGRLLNERLSGSH